MEQAGACYPYPTHPHQYPMESSSHPNYYPPHPPHPPPHGPHPTPDPMAPGPAIGAPAIPGPANVCSDACCFYHPSMAATQFYGEAESGRQVHGFRKLSEMQTQKQMNLFFAHKVTFMHIKVTS